MTVTSERTMTPDGHIAIPLDTAANREPFVERCPKRPFGQPQRKFTQSV
jgi:hypothetical protein